LANHMGTCCNRQRHGAVDVHRDRWRWGAHGAGDFVQLRPRQSLGAFSGRRNMRPVAGRCLASMASTKKKRASQLLK
jgi:hypothetical protein